MHAPHPPTLRPDGTTPLEQRLGAFARGLLPAPLAEFVMFGLKQGWASLFAALMLGAIIASKLLWRPDWPVARYDALVLFAVAVQAAFLALKLETWEEAKVIGLFHVVGTVMEIFKTHVGSWAYPEPGLLKIGGVPLFTGFMYACVGSYIARATRVLDLRYSDFPPRAALVGLTIAIYANFFAHHYIYDFRYLLFAVTVLMFARTRVYFTPDRQARWMPLLVGFLLVALFIWVAENVGTLSATWVYPGQRPGFQIVSLGKLGSWYLLMIISFALVTFVHRPEEPRA